MKLKKTRELHGKANEMKRNFVLFVFLRSIRISNMKVVCAYLCGFVLLYSFFVHSENERATFALRKRLFYLPKEALLHAKRGSFEKLLSST